MRLLNWNIRQGGGSRTPQILSAIKNHDPEVMVLTEYRSNSHLRIELERMGYLYHEAPETDDPHTNTVLVSAKLPFRATVFEEDLGFTENGDHAHRCILAQFEAFNLFGLYFPNTQDKAKRTLFQFLRGLDKKFLKQESALLGDFNTGLPYLDEPGTSLRYASDFKGLQKDGWIDAWRSRNPDKKEFSWLSPGRGNGYRFDHALVSDDFDDLILSISYSHRERDEGISDHSPMIIDLDD